MTERLAEGDVAVLRDTLLELLLEVAATVLVLAQTGYLADEVLQARAREAVNCNSKSESSQNQRARNYSHSRSMSPRLCFGP